jgi:hypothetical protein
LSSFLATAGSHPRCSTPLRSRGPKPLLLLRVSPPQERRPAAARV